MEPLSTTTTSSTTPWGILESSGPMMSASLSAGMTSEVFTTVSRDLGAPDDRCTGAASLQQIAPLGWCPLEIDRLAAHERAVGIGDLDPAGQRPPPGTAPVT